jgi:hypothetical protein
VIISGTSGTAQAKKEALEANGVRVGTNPTEVAQLVAEARGRARLALSVAVPGTKTRLCCVTDIGKGVSR